MATFVSLDVGDSVMFPGDWNGVATDPCGKIISIGQNRDACCVKLFEPIKTDKVTLEHIFPMVHNLVRMKD